MQNKLNNNNMNGQKLLEDLIPSLLRIGPSKQNQIFFKEIQKSLQSNEFIDFFHQLKKNEKGEGLAFEVMMFDKRTIHDIVITKTNIDYITVLMKTVNKIDIEATFDEVKNESGEVSLVDKLKLSISYGSDLGVLGYLTDTKRFPEINRIKDKLINTISQ